MTKGNDKDVKAGQGREVGNVLRFRPRQASGVMNMTELCSVEALVAYAAHHGKVARAKVETAVGDRFGVHAVTELQQRDYEAVIRFLVDLDWDGRKLGCV